MRFDFRLPTGTTGYYSFRIGSRAKGGYEVQNEECQVNQVNSVGMPVDKSYYRVESGTVVSHKSGMPVATADRLYLVAASSIPAFRPVYDAFSRMAF